MTQSIRSIGVQRSSSVADRLPTIAAAIVIVAAGVSLARAEPAHTANSAANTALGSMQMTTTRTLESYVPADPVRIAALELRPEASVAAGDVTLRQICRWPEADNEAFAAVADMVVMRLPPGGGFATLDIEQLQNTLRDAGLTPAAINFSGAMSCTVSRSDVKVDEGEALRQWVQSRPRGSAPAAPAIPPANPQSDQPRAPAAVPSPTATVDPNLVPDTQVAEPLARAVPQAPAVPDRSATAGDLRAMLISDVASRLHVPANTLQVDFAGEDRKLLALGAPYQFTIDPQRFGDLGDTTWNITINVGNESKRVRVKAHARAWVDQVVLTRNLGLRDVIDVNAIEVRHVLADKLAPEVVASAALVVGKQASRDLRAGTVLTGKMIAPLELVRAGQAVTVSMRRGAINIRSVATALQSGSAGSLVKVRNPSTNEVYEVQLTGPQTGVVPGSDPVVADASN